MWIKKFFAREKVDDKEIQEALKRMEGQIESVGGQFTFSFDIDEEGWSAKCMEFEGIVTGGSSKNPSEEEVTKALINTIKTAFHIPINDLEIKGGQTHELPKIKIVREREFQFC